MPTYPRININGTDGLDLLSQYGNAVALVRAARDVTQAAWPHGRDYQTLPADKHVAAQKEHVDRVRKLNSVLADLEAIQIDIAEQIDARAKTGRSTPEQGLGEPHTMPNADAEWEAKKRG